MPPTPRRFALAALASAAFVSAPPTPADACGELPPDDAVRMLLDAHFDALNRDDAPSLVALWSPAAKVTSVRNTEAGPRIVVESIQQAAKRWIATRQTTRFSVKTVSVDHDVATAKIRVTWDGHGFDDLVMFARMNRRWQMVGKLSRPTESTAPALGGY